MKIILFAIAVLIKNERVGGRKPQRRRDFHREHRESHAVFSVTFVPSLRLCGFKKLLIPQILHGIQMCCFQGLNPHRQPSDHKDQGRCTGKKPPL